MKKKGSPVENEMESSELRTTSYSNNNNQVLVMICTWMDTCAVRLDSMCHSLSRRHRIDGERTKTLGLWKGSYSRCAVADSWQMHLYTSLLSEFPCAICCAGSSNSPNFIFDPSSERTTSSAGRSIDPYIFHVKSSVIQQNEHLPSRK